MEIFSGIAASLIAGIAGLISSYIASKYSKEKRKAIEIRRSELKVELSEAQKNIIDGVSVALGDLPKTSRDKYIEYLAYSQHQDGSFPEPPIIISSSFSKEEIEHEVKNRTEVLEHRIRDIEGRFPKEATLEKVASVNDAILSTNLEALSETLKKIEDKLLTKWDVAKIVFQIIAALGGLLGLSLAIIKFVMEKSTP